MLSTINKWPGGGCLGSLSKHAQQEVEQHKKSNHSLLKKRVSIRVRFLQRFFGEYSLLKHISGYLLFAFVWALLIFIFGDIESSYALSIYQKVSVWLESNENLNVLKETIADANAAALTIQATIIALIFPVVVGLVTLLMRRGAGSINPDIQVYYYESLAYNIAASSLALVIVLSINVFFPPDGYINILAKKENNIVVFQAGLSALHLFWLIINIIGLWHFLKTSMDFVQPEKRRIIRQQFAANKAVPIEMAENLKIHIYQNAAEYLARYANIPKDKIKFEEGRFISARSEVVINIPSTKMLTDVKMEIFILCINRWLKRANKNENSDGLLIFPISMTYPHISGAVTLCSFTGETQLKPVERFLIERAFVFKESE